MLLRTYIMRPIVTDRVAWSVGRSVSLSVTVVSPAKTAEPIEFAVEDSSGPKEPCIRRGPDPHGKGQLEGEGRPIVEYKDALS